MEVSGLRARATLDGLRAWVSTAGVWSVALFVGLFVVGQLAFLPGMVFVVAAVTLWGPLRGGALAWASAVLAVSLTFLTVRGVGGRALADLERPLMRRMLARLEARPITTVFFLRSLFWLAPSLNYALALSTLRFRDFFFGSAAGLMLPVGGAALLLDRLLAFFAFLGK